MHPITALHTIPLESLHHDLQAKMVPFAGYMMPIHYTDGILQEHLHVRQHAGLFDVSHMGVILVKGDLSATALESVLPTDIIEMQPFQVKYSLLLNDQGGIMDDLLVVRLDEGFLLVVNADKKHDDLSYLKDKIGKDIDLIPLFEQALFALQGPESATVLSRFFPNILDLTFMSMMTTPYQKTTLFISRTGYTGEDGFELIVEPTVASQLFQELLAQPEVKPIGLGARDSLRLEAGLCLYGHDLNPTITPVAANLSWAIGKRRRQEGGFPGADLIVAELKDKPLQRRVGFSPDTKAIAREGATIHTAEGHIVGQVTSGTFSPSLGKPIAMGYLESNQLTNTALMVSIRHQLYPINLEKLPFVPHNYYRG